MTLELTDRLGFVVIGRNESARLSDCLQSIVNEMGPGVTGRAIYADSASSDDSCEVARRLGFQVLELDPTRPLTAARGRNEGFLALRGMAPALEYVQFVDGDSELAPGWCKAALSFLSAHAQVAVVSGRLRERYPERSVYNQLCDIEWNAPSGESTACGGLAVIRADALKAVDGYRSDLAGGEEPELCVRLREAGWKIWRIDHEMALHDAAMTTFGQWWRRMVRNGAGFAQVYLLHRHSAWGIWKAETRRAIIWGGLLPLLIVTGAAIQPAAAWATLIYPLQIVRIAARQRNSTPHPWRYAAFMTIGKFAEMQGIASFILRTLANPLRGP
ncbi:MAG: glycosyltransferase [Hyphomicrobiaceae bacterium]|nr:glycosyltransferase [Hyphomicrobiaceae bacterium]